MGPVQTPRQSRRLKSPTRTPGNSVNSPESHRQINPYPLLQAYVLHQYHGCSVTQPELLDWLWDIGISISSGQLSQLLTKGHEQFHAEKDELLATGIRCSSYIQTVAGREAI